MTTVKKMFKTALSYILILVLVLTLASAFPGAASAEPGELPDDRVADEAGHINGYIPEEPHVHKVKGGRKKGLRTAGHAASYRSDKQPWAAHVPVKDQGSAGLCWAVSVTTAAEYSYAKEENKRTGKVADFNELAPAHLGYFTYNRTNDPLFNTAGDRNVVDTSENPWYNLGGNVLWAVQHMATWSGLALESVAPYDRYELMPPFDNRIAYTDELVLENCTRSTLTTGADSIDTIKGMIEQYGAVTISLRMDQAKYMDSETAAFYDYDENPDVNHAVTIVGWDDNYDRSNFLHTYGKEDPDPNKAPKGNGAWVVQNSWGGEDIWKAGDNGFFYVSYESREYAESNGGKEAYAFDMMSADTFDYNFQYDGTCDCGDATDPGNEDFETVQGTSAANVFTNTTGAPITLGAVGYGTFNEGERDYTIDVYTGLTDPADPTSGFHANTTQASSQTVGPKTAHLSEPVSVAAGETFSIVFHFNSEGASAFCVEKDRDNGTFDRNYIIFDVQVDKGQSFFLPASSGEWEDMYDYEACFRIKGFAAGAKDPDYTVSFDPSGGEGEMDSVVKTDGEKYNLPECTFTKTDREFYAWSVGGVYKQPGDSITVSANTPVKAVWKHTQDVEIDVDNAVDNSETEVVGNLSIKDTYTGSGHTGERRRSGMKVTFNEPVSDDVEAWISILKENMQQTAQAYAGSHAISIKTDSTSDPVIISEWDNRSVTESEEIKTADDGDLYTEVTRTTGGTYGRNYQIVVTLNAEYSSAPPAKRANTLTVKGKKVKIKRAKLRKKARKIKRSKIMKVQGAEGRVTYKLVGVKKAKYRKYFKIDKKTGRLTVKKRLKKGTYRLRIRVKAAGNDQYGPATKTVTCKVRVK